MITLLPGYKPRRAYMWIVGLLFAVLLTGHAVLLYFGSSRLLLSGGLALGLIFFVLAVHLGVLGPVQSVLRRVDLCLHRQNICKELGSLGIGVPRKLICGITKTLREPAATAEWRADLPR